MNYIKARRVYYAIHKIPLVGRWVATLYRKLYYQRNLSRPEHK